MDTPPTPTHPRNSVTLPAYLPPLLSLFATHGEAAYPVGGCVRDSLRGVEPHDWDVAVTTPPEKTQDLCETAGYRVIPTGLIHGTVTVLAPLSGDPSDRTGDYAPVECTTCRTEGDYTDSRHPDSVSFTGRIEDDLSRRDFTVNAMAFMISPQIPPCHNRGTTVAQPCNEYADAAYFDRNTAVTSLADNHPAPCREAVDATAPLAVLDLFGGQADLSAGIIRCVGDPDTRFLEDALRILRAVRFAARLGFTIEPATRAAMVRRREGLSHISRERIGDELSKILCCSAPERGIRLLVESGLMPFVLPGGLSEAFTSPTASVAPPRLSALSTELSVRLAALLWGLSPAAVETNLASLRLPNAVRRAISALISVSDRPPIATPREARRTRHDLGNLAVPAWEIRRIHTGANDPDEAEIDRLITFIRASEAAAEPVRTADLAISGRDLLALGLKPGPEVQFLLYDLLSLVWDDPAANTRDTLLAAARRAISGHEYRPNSKNG